MPQNSCLSDLQARAAKASAGSRPVIVRNAGGGGSKDLQLENFSVSNGGAELIEVWQPSFIYLLQSQIRFKSGFVLFRVWVTKLCDQVR